MNHARTLLILTLVSAAAPALAQTPQLQAMKGPSGQALTGSNNFFSMSSGSGRYVLFTNNFGAGGAFQLFRRDLKTQTTVLATSETAGLTSSGMNISSNGRYVAYTITAGSPATIQLKVRDMAQALITAPSTNIRQERLFISDRGDVVFHKVTTGSNSNLVWRSASGTERILVSNTTTALTRAVGLSRDGRYVAFSSSAALLGNAAGTKRAYVYDSQLDFTTSVTATYGTPAAEVLGFTQSDNGRYLSLHHAETAGGSTSANIRVVDRLLSKVGLVTLSTFKYAYTNSMNDHEGLSVSDDGRYVAVHVNLATNHPDYRDPATGAYNDRIVRIDRSASSVVMVSRPSSGALPNGFVNLGTYISGDARFVGFASNAKNLLSTPQVSTEEPYSAYLSGPTSNYLFVEMPNSDVNWTMHAPMRLVANNLWEGELTFDGVGTDAFKFDVGPNPPPFQATPDWTTNFGDSAQPDGIADLGGGNIVVTGGAGRYRVTFNDQTKQYTVRKLVTECGSATMNLRGTFTGWTSLFMNCQYGNWWQGISIDTAAELKFDTFGDWTRNFGDNAPRDGIADPNGANIPLAGPGTYRIVFDELSGRYSTPTF